jgi:hypothetical protein
LFFGQISQGNLSYFVDGSVITAVADDSTLLALTLTSRKFIFLILDWLIKVEPFVLQ